tara:strand:+ start:375 stop:1223 length:849 start_codon:yes stop_codon:yes gene_type:complete
MIYISTGGFKNESPYDVSKNFIDAGITDIELSGGLYGDNLLNDLKKLKNRANFRVHNYFPPHKEAFVFNLASLDKDIYEQSIEHALEAMRWSVELDNPVYGLHAGYLIDPKAHELGKKIKVRQLNSREKGMSRFLEAINLLSNKAQDMGVKILIENNVLSENNSKSFKSNPFLMADSKEVQIIMDNTPDNVSLLLDLAHLKVSSNSLKFDKLDFLEKCSQWVSGYHLSDNKGLRDSNDPIKNDSWFFNYLKKDINYYTLEIYNCSLDELLAQRDLLSNFLSK